MILRGARQLVEAAEALDGVRTHRRVLDVQRLHRELHTVVWEWQHSGKPAKIKRAYKTAHAQFGVDERGFGDLGEACEQAPDSPDESPEAP